jgi:hypothetical protein
MKGKKYMGTGSTAPPILNLGSTMKQVVNFMPKTLSQFNIPGTQRMESRVDPGTI